MSSVQKVARVADAISQCAVLLEEDLGAVPDADEVLQDRFPSGPLGAFQSRLNELLRRSDLRSMSLDQCPTLREIEAHIRSDGEAQLGSEGGWAAACTLAFGSSWVGTAVGAVRDGCPSGWVRYVSTSRPRAVAEGVRLFVVGALVLTFLLTGYLVKSSQDMGVAPYTPPSPPSPLKLGSRRGVRQRPFRSPSPPNCHTLPRPALVL